MDLLVLDHHECLADPDDKSQVTLTNDSTPPIKDTLKKDNLRMKGLQVPLFGGFIGHIDLHQLQQDQGSP